MKTTRGTLNSSVSTKKFSFNKTGFPFTDTAARLQNSDVVESLSDSESLNNTFAKANFSNHDISKEDRAARFASRPENNRYDELKLLREELRKRYIQEGKIANPLESQELSNAIQFVGECHDMCPEFERYERELQMGLDPLEKIPGTEFVDHEKAVKRFRRSAAGDEEPLPCDVRPPAILEKTLNYLFANVLNIHGLEKSYGFIRDRTRAIRKDFFLQNYRGIEAVRCHEYIARYHILCSHVQCENANVSLQQEHEQLRKTLQSLREYYSDLSKETIYSDDEAEFQAYYILSHLFQNEFSSRAEKLRPEVFNHRLVQLALEVHNLAQKTNEFSRSFPRSEGSLNAWTRLFRILSDENTPYLFACVAHISFVSIRKSALKAMQKAFYCAPENDEYLFKIDEIQEILALDDEEDVLDHFRYYEIPFEIRKVGMKSIFIGKILGATSKRKELIKEDNRASFSPKVSKIIIEKKRHGRSDFDIIMGYHPIGTDNELQIISSSPSFDIHVKPLFDEKIWESCFEFVLNEFLQDEIRLICDSFHQNALTSHYRRKLLEQQQLKNMVAQKEKERKSREDMMNSAVSSVINELIDLVLNLRIFNFLNEEKELVALVQTYNLMVDSLIEECCFQVCLGAVLGAKADMIFSRKIQSGILKIWKSKVSESLKIRELRESKARRIVNTLNRLDSTSKPSGARAFPASLSRYDVFGRAISTPHIMRSSIEKVSMQKFKIDQILFRAYLKQIYFKVLISCDSIDVFYLDDYLERWVISHFLDDFERPLITDASISFTKCSCVQDAELNVCVELVNVSNSCSTKCIAPSFAIYIGTLYRPDWQISSYLISEFDRLVKFLKRIPPNATEIPILAVIPTTCLLRLNHIKIELESRLDSSFQIEFLEVQLADPNDFSFMFEEHKTETGLYNLLSEMIKPLKQIELKTDLVSFWTDAGISYLNNLVDKASRDLSKSQALEFINICIELYNLQIDTAIGTLLDCDRLSLIAWPPLEFEAKLNISSDWNRIESLNQNSKILADFKLSTVQYFESVQDIMSSCLQNMMCFPEVSEEDYKYFTNKMALLTEDQCEFGMTWFLTLESVNTVILLVKYLLATASKILFKYIQSHSIVSTQELCLEFKELYRSRCYSKFNAWFSKISESNIIEMGSRKRKFNAPDHLLELKNLMEK